MATLKAQIEREHSQAAAMAAAQELAAPPTPGKLSSQQALVGAAGRTPKKSPAALVASDTELDDDDDDDEESDFSEEEELFSDEEAEDDDDEEPDEEWTPAMEKAQTNRRAAAAAAKNKSALSSSGRLSTSPARSLDASPAAEPFTAHRFRRTLSSFDDALATARHRMSLDSNSSSGRSDCSLGDASEASSGADTLPTAAGRAKKAAASSAADEEGHAPADHAGASGQRGPAGSKAGTPLPGAAARAALTVPALKELCRARGLVVSGRKSSWTSAQQHWLWTLPKVLGTTRHWNLQLRRWAMQFLGARSPEPMPRVRRRKLHGLQDHP